MDVSSVATHAQSYLERVVKEDDLATPNAFFGGHDKPKPANNDEKEIEKRVRFNNDKKGICYKWRDTGKCRWERCPYEHPGRNESNPEEGEELPGQYVLKSMPGFSQ